MAIVESGKNLIAQNIKGPVFRECSVYVIGGGGGGRSRSTENKEVLKIMLYYNHNLPM